jgi:DNA repair protein RecN (Recombination protein N)
MISYLRVRNLAIVEEFAIEPGPGLNVLTGETGAGKSLLIDSLEFLSGARGSVDAIRTGEEKMSAEALFVLPEDAGALLEDLAVDTEPAEGLLELVIRREISSSGRGRLLLNGSLAAVRDLVKISDAILQIHGQEASRERIAGQTFREVLDQFAGNGPPAAGCAAAYERWRAAARELAELEGASRDRALTIDLLRYQIDEIESANPLEGEEEKLREEKALLAHAREVIETASGAFALLDDDESGALTQVGRALALLHPLARSVDEVRKLAEELEDARFRLEDVSRAAGQLAESTRLDPERLEAIEERLVILERLRRKYGGSTAAVLTHLDGAREEYARLSSWEESLESLRAAEKAAFDVFRDAASSLSERRRSAARELERSVQKELVDLAMEGTAVRVSLTVQREESSPLSLGGENVAFGPHGYDRVEFLVAPNRGEELRPIQKVASGGELSRIQLAIAAALFRRSERAGTATLVFDEIDAGIGGRVAEVVGRKLRDLSSNNQVVCVTHLGQIASLADVHFRVWKEESRGRTVARIDRLDGRDQRIDELARMIGGSSITGAARAHAIDLLDRASVPGRKRSSAKAVANADDPSR